jgi:hypothetical protein
LNNRIHYKDTDITFDLLMKIEHVVRVIAGRERMDFDSAYRAFAASATYGALMNPASVLWAESAEFIADEYGRESGRC